MASVFKVYGINGDAKEWYAQQSSGDIQWEYDEVMSGYHCGNIYVTVYDDCASFKDLSETEFFGWGTDSWIKQAGGKELIFGHYEEGNGNAEFIHVKDNECIREYRAYDFEDAETDEGDEPVFSSWVDVASYVDQNLF